MIEEDHAVNSHTHDTCAAEGLRVGLQPVRGSVRISWGLINTKGRIRYNDKSLK